MSQETLDFINEKMLEKLNTLDIKIDAKVILAKELGRILTMAKDVA